jgi:hypothetical protein
MTVSLWSIADNVWASAFFASTDLKVWTYINNSLIRPPESEARTILGNGGLAWFDNKYWFNYQNNGDQVGLSWSTDLLTWNLVSGSIVAAGYDPAINVNMAGNGLEMWYVHPVSRAIYLMTSSNGLAWSSATLYLAKNSYYSADFGAPSVFYMNGIRYMVVDSSVISGNRNIHLYHSVGSNTTWVYDGFFITTNFAKAWENKQSSDCAVIVADLNDGWGNVPRVLYVGSDNLSAIDDTHSSIALTHLKLNMY